MTRATVLVPTFDHGPTLKYAVRSALDQTVADIEIFIVGDGVPPLARSYIEELVKEDSRVRLFINDKGPRHGEIHRARALEEASGEIVCYLSDDDLWLPDHLAVMSELLEDADFAHCLPIRVEPGGRIGGWPIDLAEKADRQLLLGGENRIPLSCSGHTLAAYRRLPHGWRTTPDNVPTDLYMFQQFLVTDWVRTVSGSRPTCLHFPSPDRFDWSSERRLAELALWADRMADVEWRQRELTGRVLGVEAVGWAGSDREARALRRERNDLERQLHDTTERLEAQRARLDRNQDEVVLLRSELEDATVRSGIEASRLADAERSRADIYRQLGEARRRQGEAQQELEWMTGSLTWRIRGWLLDAPVVGSLVRWVARTRARRGGS
jgi:GalNAc5-diNAcBac-PP-undecaprenol beta-1,3-glucosyltransferase